MRLYQLATASTTTRFAYDGLALIAEYDGSNALQRRYVFGPGTDEAIVWYEGSGTTDRRFMSSDERGSIVSLTDSSGALIAINRYDEYGIPQSANIGRFQYTGQAWLAELGLQYSKARIYSPTLGRFLQTDPIGYEDSPNPYQYVLSDPVNYTDPLGLCMGGEVWVKTGGGVSKGKDGGPVITVSGFCMTLRPTGEGVGSHGPGIGGGNGRDQKREKDPKYSTCTSALAGPIYKAGGILTSTGENGLALAAGVLILGGGPEDPVALGLSAGIAALSTDALVVGQTAQVAAGFYYAAHGNWDPLANVAINHVIGHVAGLAKVPQTAQPSLSKAAEATEAKMEPKEHECEP
jgi:RHS repeat-associated protein